MSHTDFPRFFLSPPDLPTGLWSATPEQFNALLTAEDVPAEFTPDPAWMAELILLALHMAIEAPAGRPTDASEFLDRLTVGGLARAWGGVAGQDPWKGHPRADQLIVTLVQGKQPVLSILLARCHNLFRFWTRRPDVLEKAARNAGIALENSVATTSTHRAPTTVRDDLITRVQANVAAGHITTKEN